MDDANQSKASDAERLSAGNTAAARLVPTLHAARFRIARKLPQQLGVRACGRLLGGTIERIDL
jgi:hypothetical protein